MKRRAPLSEKFAVLFPKLVTNRSSLFIGNGALKRTAIQAYATSKIHFKCFEANSARENLDAAPMRTVLRNMNAQSYEECPGYSYFMPSKL